MQLTNGQLIASNRIQEYLVNPNKPYLVIDGFAGVGKSYLISVIRRAMPSLKIAVIAFTGKAVSVLKRKGVTDARTIHSLLFTPYCDLQTKTVKYQLNSTIDCDVVIVDEASMVSEEIFNSILSFNKPTVFVGDSFQLPPVDGNYFNVMDEPDVQLTEIVRQARDNPIIGLSEHVREGKQFFYLNLNNYGTNIRRVTGIEAYNNLLKYDIVIVATNKSRRDINHSVRKLMGYDPVFPQKGDKIVCRRNRKGGLAPYNGQLFTLKTDPHKINENYDLLIECLDEEDREHVFQTNLFNFLEYDTDKEVSCKLSEAEKNREVFPFQYAYALTCHNSQGSEYDKVLVVNDLHKMPCDLKTKLRWTYTSVTRAKESLDVVDYIDIEPHLKYELFKG